jgi:hypothetical protein
MAATPAGKSLPLLTQISLVKSDKSGGEAVHKPAALKRDKP